MLNKKNKKAQEEMVGFVMIVVIVIVILLVFLSLSLRKPSSSETIKSYEVESFLQAMLQATSSCEQGFNENFLSTNELIKACERNELCLNNNGACEVLEQEATNILENSWNIQINEAGESVETPIKGYNLVINTQERNLLEISKGITTGNSKGSLQSLPGNIDIEFKVFY